MGMLRLKVNSPTGGLGGTDADETIRIVWNKIIGNFHLGKQFNDCDIGDCFIRIHRHCFIVIIRFLVWLDLCNHSNYVRLTVCRTAKTTCFILPKWFWAAMCQGFVLYSTSYYT